MGEENCQAGEYVEPEPTITETIIDWIVPDEGTFGFGASVTGGAAVYFTISVGLQFDSQGNVGVAISPGGGGLLPAAAEGTGFATWTDAENLDQVKGVSMMLGGSLEAGGSVGYETVFFRDRSTGEKFRGGTVTLGYGKGAPLPGEGHVGITYTWIPVTINLYDFFHLDQP